jgi:hypothetical protein
MGSGVQMPKPSDIVIEHHPHSKKGTTVLSPEEFKAFLRDDAGPTEQPDDEPWRPFRSRKDFEFAELLRDGAINRSQTERWIKYTQSCQVDDGTGPFTIKNCNDLKKSLQSASKLLTPVIVWVVRPPTDIYSDCA